MSEKAKTKGTLALAASDEQGNISSVRVSGLAQLALTALLILVGIYAAATHNKDLTAFVEKAVPWISTSGAATLLWGQIKSAFVLGQQQKAPRPPTAAPEAAPISTGDTSQ